MKKKKNKVLVFAVTLFIVGFVLIWVGAVTEVGVLISVGGIMCGSVPGFLAVYFIVTAIVRANKSRQSRMSAFSAKDTMSASAPDNGKDDDSWKDYKSKKSEPDPKQEAYDAVLDREFDFVDWLEDRGDEDLRDEYIDKAYDLWDLYTGEDGDDTLDRLTELLDKYEERAEYTRPVQSNGDDDGDENAENLLQSATDSKVSGSVTYGRGKKNSSSKLGCLFMIFFIAMFITTIVLFVNNLVTAGIISFFTLFAVVIIFVSSMFIRERVIFSTHIDPKKYEFKNGVVVECYHSGTTTVNNTRTYKTFVLTLDVDGREVTAYARLSHKIGEIVHLAVRKDKPLAKLVDDEGKAIYCYNYDYYLPPKSAKSATVGMSEKFGNTSEPTTSSAPTVGSKKSPYQPIPLRSEVIMPTPDVEELCKREDKLTDALEDRGMFTASNEYRRRAETFWDAYEGGVGDDDDLMLNRISSLIDTYTAMYLDGKNPEPSAKSYETVAAPEEKVRADKEKAQAMQTVVGAMRKVAEEKAEVTDAADKVKLREKLDKIETLEKEKPNRSYKKAARSIAAQEQPTEPEAAKAAETPTVAEPTTELEPTVTKAEEVEAEYTAPTAVEEPQTEPLEQATAQEEPVAPPMPEPHIPSAPHYGGAAERPKTDNAAGRRIGYKPSKK